MKTTRFFLLALTAVALFFTGCERGAVTPRTGATESNDICGDSLYVFSNSWSYFTQTSEVSYGIVNVKNRSVVTRRFITDGTEESIQNPYGIAVNPNTREIFITDARDNITPGKLYCFSPDGKLKWIANTGDIPSRITFTRVKLQ